MSPPASPYPAPCPSASYLSRLILSSSSTKLSLPHPTKPCLPYFRTIVHSFVFSTQTTDNLLTWICCSSNSSYLDFCSILFLVFLCFQNTEHRRFTTLNFLLLYSLDNSPLDFSFLFFSSFFSITFILHSLSSPMTPSASLPCLSASLGLHP